MDFQLTPTPSVDFQVTLKPHLHASKNRHGTPNSWRCADDFQAWHSQFSTCKCITSKCNVAPVTKILEVPILPPGRSVLHIILGDNDNHDNDVPYNGS